MIWVKGEIVPDDALKISVLDRTFEHGLGLFETFRTWSGHATLLDRHLARMTDSAAALGLRLDPSTLPDERAVLTLLRASGYSGDAMLRLTMSGGTAGTSPSTVWMRPSALPATTDESVVLVASPLRVDPGDKLARHKTLNYWPRRLAHEQAISEGGYEALVAGIEGSRTNVFLVVEGVLTTTSEAAPILPGIMRSVVLEFAERLGIATMILPWTSKLDLGSAGEVMLTNSVRGIIPVRRALNQDYLAPGPVTCRLRFAIQPWLESGGIEDADR